MQSERRSGLGRAEDAGRERLCLPGTYNGRGELGEECPTKYTKHTKRAWGWIPPTLPCLAVPANRNLNIHSNGPYGAIAPYAEQSLDGAALLYKSGAARYPGSLDGVASWPRTQQLQ